MLDILRYFWRRKIRTALTILAVTVGIFAVTAVGGIAEEMNRSIAAAEHDPHQRITLRSRDFVTPLDDSAIRHIRRLDGVAGLTRRFTGEIERPDDTVVRVLLNPEMFVGVLSDVAGLEYEPPEYGLKLWRGRLPGPASRVETVVSWTLADSKGLDVGDTLMIRERPFTVVGIWEKATSAESRIATINYDVALDLLDEYERYEAIAVIPVPGTDPEALAAHIEEVIPEAQANSPSEATALARQQVLIFSAVVGASGVLSLLIGTFTIVNTMVVSVQERRREIGLKKALGAEDGHILSEVVIEAVLIALIGAILGIGSGFLVGQVANRLLLASLGAEIHSLTPRLGVGIALFSVVMGVVAGIYPAWRAARLNPVIALRDGSNATYAGRGIKRLWYLIKRNARNILTVGGIAIGVFALVLLGSLSEALTMYLGNVTDGSSDLLIAISDSAAAPVNRSAARVLRRIPGVKDVILTGRSVLPINFSGHEDEDGVEVTIWASESRTGDLGMVMLVRNEIAVGRYVAPGSTDEVVLGAGRASSEDVHVGDSVLIDEQPFTVVGIWGRIPFDVSGHDVDAFVTMEALERLMGNSDTFAGLSIRTESVSVMPDVAEAVATELPGLEALSITDTLGDVRQVFMGLIAVIAGIFSVAVFVGGISVVNTMVIAVNEQTRQIGLKKAVGAENGDILAEVLMDAARLGAIGGVSGVGLAWVITLILNPLIRAQLDLDILWLSPRLVLGSVVFSIVLAVVSGVFPARRASKLDPVVALHAD